MLFTLGHNVNFSSTGFLYPSIPNESIKALGQVIISSTYGSSVFYGSTGAYSSNNTIENNNNVIISFIMIIKK